MNRLAVATPNSQHNSKYPFALTVSARLICHGCGGCRGQSATSLIWQDGKSRGQSATENGVLGFLKFCFGYRKGLIYNTIKAYELR